MTIVTAPTIARMDHFAALLSGLRSEFDAADVSEIAARFVECEACDFYWEARIQEAWVGEYECLDDDGETLDRIAILSDFGGRFHVGIALVDGDGGIHDLRAYSSFTSVWDAEGAFDQLQH